jgi:hypothetical protein
MRPTKPARTASRGTPRLTVFSLVVVAAMIGTLACTTASSSARSHGETRAPGAHGTVPQSTPVSAPSLNEVPGGELGRARTRDDGAVTEADGALPDGVTVFDDGYPGIANLDPHLLQSLRDAARDADEDGVELTINSGWRSANYQNALLRAAVSEYGSEKEAARWVATADTSPHVSGDAVDIASVDGTTWLSKHGAGYGLCQIYRNEPWHFELRPHPIGRGCPEMYTDPTRDPRMQK